MMTFSSILDVHDDASPRGALERDPQGWALELQPEWRERDWRNRARQTRCLSLRSLLCLGSYL